MLKNTLTFSTTLVSFAFSCTTHLFCCAFLLLLFAKRQKKNLDGSWHIMGATHLSLTFIHSSDTESIILYTCSSPLVLTLIADLFLAKVKSLRLVIMPIPTVLHSTNPKKCVCVPEFSRARHLNASPRNRSDSDKRHGANLNTNVKRPEVGQ